MRKRGAGGSRITPPKLGKTVLFEESGAESGAATPQNPTLDPLLAEVVHAWPTLSSPIRAAVQALMRSAANTFE